VIDGADICESLDDIAQINCYPLVHSASGLHRSTTARHKTGKDSLS